MSHSCYSNLRYTIKAEAGSVSFNQAVNRWTVLAVTPYGEDAELTIFRSSDLGLLLLSDANIGGKSTNYPSYKLDTVNDDA